MDKQVLRKRIKAIRRRMGSKRISCLLVTKPANVTYVTGFMGEDSWALLTKNRTYLLTDSRYTEQAQKECPNCKIIARTGLMSQAVADLVEKLKSVRTVRVEESTSVAEFAQLEKIVRAQLKTTASPIEAARTIKDEREIATVKAAASNSARALSRTLAHVRPGTSESELAGRLDFEIRKLGGRSSFETIVAFGPNASRPHHQPGSKKLRKNDTILIDFGARYRGYCSDITRCFVIGKANALYTRAFDAVERAQAAAIRVVRAGARLADVDAAARQVIADAGLPVYGHGTGHGFGLEIHEPPFLKAEAAGKLEAGQVITIEPGVYMPGRLGVRIEDDVLVTETGCKVLTQKCPHRVRLTTDSF